MQGLQRPLGFCESPRTLYLYAHRNNGTKLWFHLADKGDSKEPVEISQPALTGYLKEIDFPKVERRQQECRKLHIKIKAHRPVVIECGYDSQFAKSFIVAIATLTPAQLQQPITLEAMPGREDKVLFCAVWLGSKPIKTESDEVADWRAVAEQAIANVKAAQGARV